MLKQCVKCGIDVNGENSGRYIFFVCPKCRNSYMIDLKKEIEKYLKNKPIIRAFFRKDKDRT